MEDIDPCRQCGSPVRMVTQQLPKRLAEKQPQTIEVRECTNPSCETNRPRGQRRMNVVP